MPGDLVGDWLALDLIGIEQSRSRMPSSNQEPKATARAAVPGSRPIKVIVAGCRGGLNFGYYYENLPIIAYDDEAPSNYTLYDFSPSTVPGCRTPHLWVRNGRSLYHALGSEFTLLRFDPTVGVGTLITAAACRDLPLAVIDVDAADAAELYPSKLLLSRPDQHVAWRGNTVPDDAMALIDRIRGASPGS